MKVTLPIHTVNESNARGHWAEKAKRAKAHRRAAALAVKVGAQKLCRGLISVTLTRVSPGTLDDDNLRSALKSTRDGVADALRIDDGSPVVQWLYAQMGGDQHEVIVEVCLADTSLGSLG